MISLCFNISDVESTTKLTAAQEFKCTLAFLRYCKADWYPLCAGSLCCVPNLAMRAGMSWLWYITTHDGQRCVSPCYHLIHIFPAWVVVAPVGQL
jgi:hypothetical protein